uniref:EOG090X0BDJ n=1 Tax=Lynceus sp. MCZ IZ 141354 TaxID=1930659 RepID=A0A9N6WT12_9CRUS|nr:EOG090X0BDJ [Lynceus sp. MCZ IZ 141354]
MIRRPPRSTRSEFYNRRRFECSTLPKGWIREEVYRRKGLCSGKVDVYYYSPTGKRFFNKPQLARVLGDTIDLSAFDYQTGRFSALLARKQKKKAQYNNPMPGLLKNEILVGPIRQTASIFKQPVTIVRSQDSKARHDLKHGPQDKPKQLFWEKRLENVSMDDPEVLERPLKLPSVLRPVSSLISPDTALHSLASALHTLPQGVAVTGQSAALALLEKNLGVFLNPDQPVLQAIVITDDDIRLQEERVFAARSKLQNALRSL